jgi:hypothetical protein
MSKIPWLLFMLMSLMGCHSQISQVPSASTLEGFASLQSVKDYLSTKVATQGFGGKSFCAYDVLGATTTGQTTTLYLWALCQEYYRANQALQQGTGSSFPIAVTLNTTLKPVQVTGHRQPRDGALYAEDMPVIFPESVRAKLQREGTHYSNQRVGKLQAEAAVSAERGMR